MDERQECDEFVNWAQGRTKSEINSRIAELVKTNSFAAEMFHVVRGTAGGAPSSAYGVGGQDRREVSPVMEDHTGYNRGHSANWEHDNTGSQMNYSGMSDIMLGAMAENNGWEAGYDYPADSDVAPE